jgi:integrase
MTMEKQSKHRDYGDGSVYQRKSDGRWVASFRLPNGQRKYLYRDSKAQARDSLKKALRELEQGTLITTRHCETTWSND